MRLIYSGIDEAGYGPMLGPLVVARSAFGIDRWLADQPAPNLWKVLERAVCRKGNDKAGRLPIDDSKKLKRANDTDQPLQHLERTVLAALAVLGQRPSTDLELFRALGVEFEPHAWYEGEALPLPSMRENAECARARVGIDANLLAVELSKQGVELLELAAVSVGESAFNAIIKEEGSKAATTGCALAMHLQHAWKAWGRAEGMPPGGARIVCDRQGGRADYTEQLASWIPDVGRAVRDGRGEMVTTEQNEQHSRYRVCVREPDGERGEMTLHFQTESESLHLPIAMASMAAKLTRELMMARFNRYWSGRAMAAGFEIKPTAGYVQDGRRWLAEMKRVVTTEERRAMVRNA